MYQTNHEANGRTPQPERRAIAREIRLKRRERNRAEQVNARDDAQRRADEREPANDARARERVQRPTGQDGDDARSNDRRIPMPGGSHPRHPLASAEESIPRGAEEDAAHV